MYYRAYNVGHVRGKIVQKYVVSTGRSQNSTGEVEPGVLLKYVEGLVKKNVSQEEINQIPGKIGIEYDIWPVIKIIMENELKMKRITLTRAKQ